MHLQFDQKVTRSTWIASILVLAMVVFLCFSMLPKNQSQLIATKPRYSILSDFMVHDPISITHNDNFTDFGFSGSGTEESPYLIIGLEIVSNGSIPSIRIGPFVTAHYSIEECSISGSRGIQLDEAGISIKGGFASILGNTIFNNSLGIGVATTNSVLIENNTFSNHLVASIDGVGSDLSIIRNNTFNAVDGIRNIKWNAGEGLLIQKNSFQANETHCESIHILMHSCHGVVISENVLEVWQCGVDLVFSNDTIIEGNSIETYQLNDWGITGLLMNDMHNTTIAACRFITLQKTLNNSAIGLSIRDGTNVSIKDCVFKELRLNLIDIMDGTIANCSIEDTVNSAILIEVSSHIEIFGNEIHNCSEGSFSGAVDLFSTDSVSIQSNAISECKDGIVLQNNTNRSLLSNNWIGKCDTGIKILSGTKNWIYYNRLFNNTEHALDTGYVNLWDDNKSLGNYWDDAVEGQPYDVGESVDRYPVLFELNAPIINRNPKEITYGSTTFNATIGWTFIEDTPAFFRLHLNANVIASGAWNGSDISLNHSGSIGETFNATIVVTDMNGNRASDVWLVTITATTAPNEQDTTSLPSLPPSLTIAAGVLSVIAVFAVVIVLARSR